ncbi:hypothetical protein OHO28_08640 [Streptomyces europaeiscabiei]|uniref:AMP-binding enzyme n=1 Tax=Streptomyces europaeiscabiei TaxID=146819 RepID=UPI002E19CA79
MEEALASHPDAAECAVIGVDDPLKGQVPRGFVVMRVGTANRARSRPSSSSPYANASARSPPSRTSWPVGHPAHRAPWARPAAGLQTAPGARSRPVGGPSGNVRGGTRAEERGG